MSIFGGKWKKIPFAKAQWCLRIRCPECQTQHQYPPEQFGHPFCCPDCGKMLETDMERHRPWVAFIRRHPRWVRSFLAIINLAVLGFIAFNVYALRFVLSMEGEAMERLTRPGEWVSPDVPGWHTRYESALDAMKNRKQARLLVLLAKPSEELLQALRKEPFSEFLFLSRQEKNISGKQYVYNRIIRKFLNAPYRDCILVLDADGNELFRTGLPRTNGAVGREMLEKLHKSLSNHAVSRKIHQP